MRASARARACAADLARELERVQSIFPKTLLFFVRSCASLCVLIVEMCCSRAAIKSQQTAHTTSGACEFVEVGENVYKPRAYESLDMRALINYLLFVKKNT